MIVDTNILVDYLRDKEEAIRFIELSEADLSISVVSITELYAGMRGRDEVLKAQDFIETFRVLPVDDAIARKAGEYLNFFAKTHNFGIADALIAATATFYGEQVATRNVKDFPMLDVLKPY